jgi:DNA polymerase-4
LQATAQTRIVLRTARELLNASAPLIGKRGLTLIGIAVSNLADDLPLQLALPLEAADTELLDAVLDEIRERFGPTAVTRAVLLDHRRLEMPLLPD